MRHLQSSDSQKENDFLFEIIFAILIVFLGLTVLYILCKLRRILLLKINRYSNRQALEENQEYISRQESKKNKGSKRVNTQPLTQTENENQKSLNKVKPNSDPQLEKRSNSIKQQDQLNEEVIHENEKSREHLDTSVHKNFFAIDQEDFDAQQDVNNLEQVKNPMEYSEHNLSNVFNLEGEDFSQRQYQKKKVKDKKGNGQNYSVVNVNQF